jgi:hypothetical protein
MMVAAGTVDMPARGVLCQQIVGLNQQVVLMENPCAAFRPLPPFVCSKRLRGMRISLPLPANSG